MNHRRADPTKRAPEPDRPDQHSPPPSDRDDLDSVPLPAQIVGERPLAEEDHCPDRLGRQSLEKPLKKNLRSTHLLV